MNDNTPEELSARLVSAFFKISRTPWHNAPADGLSWAETDILENIRRSIRHGKKPCVSDLSSALRVSSPTITQHLNNLEDQGLVERLQSSEDKRTVNLSLTEKGEEALKSHRIRLEQDFNEFIRLIGEESSEAMIALLLQANAFFSAKAKSHETGN